MPAPANDLIPQRLDDTQRTIPPKDCVFLMYHELELPGRKLCQSEPGYVRYILSLEAFRSQMAWLKEQSWRGLSVTEALHDSARRPQSLHHLSTMAARPT